MRTISLWQPWASLVAVGAKSIETRHWPAPPGLVGQRIGVHAAKTRAHLSVAATQPFAGSLAPGDLPLGMVVATVVLDRCTEISERGARELAARLPDEFAFGNYEAGRFAWVLRDVEQLAAPVAFRGSQGFFDVPDELLATGVSG